MAALPSALVGDAVAYAIPAWITAPAEFVPFAATPTIPSRHSAERTVLVQGPDIAPADRLT